MTSGKTPTEFHCDVFHLHFQGHPKASESSFAFFSTITQSLTTNGWNMVNPALKVTSLEGFWSSQVSEPKSLYIRFRSFCRKLSLSPILLICRAHSTSASEKECKTPKLKCQHSKLQPARGTSWVCFPLALCTPVFCLWDGTHTQTHNIHKHTVTQTGKRKEKWKVERRHLLWHPFLNYPGCGKYYLISKYKHLICQTPRWNVAGLRWCHSFFSHLRLVGGMEVKF